jgi:hypothetical protein
MPTSSSSKVFRAVLLPLGAVVGAFAAPALFMPDADELLRAGKFVDGTGYGSAGLSGLIGGAVIAYIVRTILDRTIWYLPKGDSTDRAG